MISINAIWALFIFFICCYKADDCETACRRYDADNNDYAHKNYCEALEKTYAAWGILDKKENGKYVVPEEWKCDKPRSQSMTGIQQAAKDCIGRKPITIVLLGSSGTGKSYFANALTTANGEVGPFSTGNSAASVTHTSQIKCTQLFGGKYSANKNDYIQVIDTPGFDDSDSTKFNTNARQIGLALELDINAFVLLRPSGNSGRVTSYEKEMMKLLNEWTNGKIWKNLIVVQNPKVTYLNDAIDMNEAVSFENFKTEMQRKIKAYPKFWHGANADDIANIEGFYLNMQQANYCGNPKKLTKISDYFNGKTNKCLQRADRPMTGLESLNTGHYYFLEETQKFVAKLKTLQSTPVKSVKLSKLNEMKNRINAYRTSLDNRLENSYKNSNADYSKTLHTWGCPKYTGYGSWGSCQSNCHQYRDRSCYIDLGHRYNVDWSRCSRLGVSKTQKSTSECHSGHSQCRLHLHKIGHKAKSAVKHFARHFGHHFG